MKLYNFNSANQPNYKSKLDCNFLKNHETKLYILHFNKIPAVITEQSINISGLVDDLKLNYESKIKDYSFEYYYKDNEDQSDEYFIFENELLLYLDYRSNTASIYHQANKSQRTFSTTILELINKHKNLKNKTNEISLIVTYNQGMEIRRKKLNKVEVSIPNYYNDDFQPINKIIETRLKQINDKGIILLHGEPGTGKTNYIKYLIQNTDKEVIFIPPNMADCLTNPTFLRHLLHRKDFVLVIEDAEKVILNREQNGNNSAVSALLNLSDGILSDCMNIQIICTFNTDIAKIDKALMRKGRLIASYEFKALETEKANKLSQQLGFESNFTQPQTLADVFNQNEQKFFNKKRQVIGF